jgi:hypothetical protein
MKKNQWTLLVIMTLAIFISCQKDELEENAALETTTQNFQGAEEAFPGQIGIEETLYYGKDQITVEKINGQYIFEGDIIFSEEQLTKEPNEDQRLLGSLERHWPGNIVPFEIEPNFPNQQRITDAIAHIEATTAVRFLPHTSQEDYATFREGSGCSANLGRIRGEQFITLTYNCPTGAVIHEIAHTIGIRHEQTRADRDTHIIVNTQNILSGKERQFRIHPTSRPHFYTFYFDFDSIMLYGSFAFSKNGEPTIVKIDGSTYTANRDFLSSDDIDGINFSYPASDGNGQDWCYGATVFNPSVTYSRGDFAVMNNALFELRSQPNNWRYMGECN